MYFLYHFIELYIEHMHIMSLFKVILILLVASVFGELFKTRPISFGNQMILKQWMFDLLRVDRIVNDDKTYGRVRIMDQDRVAIQIYYIIWVYLA